MVAKTVALPNVKKLFIPDPGYVLTDWDLDRADLQVVVWEADDLEMKQMLREGVDMHTENAKALHCTRDMAKRFVHGTNYGGSARTMAINCGLTVHQSDMMQRRWFSAHPGIKQWHHRTEENLQQNRMVTNRFGFRRVYFDRIDNLLPEALAWQPQSTVAHVIDRGWKQLETEGRTGAWCNNNLIQVLLQVHDSLVMQVHKSLLPLGGIAAIRDSLLVTIPYPDPLIIPVGCKLSHKSWGDCEDYEI